MINVVVEGASDRGIARAVVRAAGREVGKIVAKGGKTRLDPDIPKYNRPAPSGLCFVIPIPIALLSYIRN